MYTPEQQQKIEEWRRKAADNTLTKDECKEVVAFMRAGRSSVKQATAGSAVTKSRKAAAVKPNGDDLFDQLGAL